MERRESPGRDATPPPTDLMAGRLHRRRRRRGDRHCAAGAAGADSRSPETGHLAPRSRRPSPSSLPPLVEVDRWWWWRRLARGVGEEAVESPVRVSLSDIRAVRWLDHYVWLPNAAKAVLFYVLDFLSHKRVLVVVAAIAVAVALTYVDVYDIVGSDFVVDHRDRPGATFLSRTTAKARHPVAIIPGFITSALEVWEAPECARSGFSTNFRQRMFGPQMLFLVLKDPLCYLRLFSMDRRTGGDPEGAKVRADAGFGAADYVLPGYWVWAKVLLNLADIGYDPQSMSLLSYDWRLAPRRTHQRDGYYHFLRHYIQFLVERNGAQRAVVIAHSYGTTVAVDFFQWVEARHPGWVERYVEAFVNVGGPMMGLSKAVAALLTGDMRDTLTLPRPVRVIFDKVVTPATRYDAFRTWSCLAAMFPATCDGLFPRLLQLPNGTLLGPRKVLAYAVEKTRESGHTSTRDLLQERLDAFARLPVLPQAKTTTVYCLYGVSKPAEVGYVMRDDGTIDMTSYDPNTTNGVILGDGDGTVPLQSLGYMCRAPNGWARNVQRVVTHELLHDGDVNHTLNIRGGAASADHVDILGNHELLDILLKIVTGHGDQVVDRIFSNIDDLIRQAGDCLAVDNTPPGQAGR